MYSYIATLQKGNNMDVIYRNGSCPGVFFSSGHDWSETRRLSVRILKKLGLGRDHMESLAAYQAFDLVKKLKETRGKPLEMRRMMNLTTLGALWQVLTDEELKAGKLDRVWANLDKLAGELTTNSNLTIK